VGNVADMVEMVSAYVISIGKTEGHRPLGRPRRRLKYNIRTCLKERRSESMDWIQLGHD